jgi:hypothetical protein
MKVDTANSSRLARSHDDLDPANGGEGVAKFLKRDARVTEEQLFGAAVAERLTHHSGEQIAASFEKAFRQEKARLREVKGERSVEEAALNALQQLTETGEVLESVRNKVYNQAFRMAQIDGDINSLENARSAEKAFTSRDEAIELANDRTFLFVTTIDPETGEDEGGIEEEIEWTGTPTSSEAASVPTAEDLGIDLRGFLWKPISESDGKLVVLMPSHLTGKIKSLSLRDSSGQELEEGRFSGNANGGRDHFRFGLAGKDYNDATLHVALRTGDLFTILIDDPGSRDER